MLMPAWLALAFAALVLPAAVCYRRAGDSASGESDEGDGGGSRPQAPNGPRPTGGIPLPDADPAATRRRDHNRPKLIPAHERRRAREPQRRPTPAHR
jgi:hypothetical protein